MSNSSKYNTVGAIRMEVFTRYNLDETITIKMAETANMALSKNTKSNYQTVKKNIVRCAEMMDCDLSFPWGTGEVLKFLAYLLYTRKVKTCIANSQLSVVRMAHL